MKDDSFDCTLIAHLRSFLLFYRLLYCLILPENRLFFGIWKVVEIEFELLKRAIKELGEKYGDNVSNEELVSLEGEFLPVSQCYGKLIKKTHAERLLELYNTLPATKGETSGYSKERLDTLYKVFCHSFSAVIMYDAGIYVGNALVLSCRNKNSSFLPVEPTDNERFWKEATVGNITSELIEGEHLTCMTGSYADKVAERILKEERL